MSAFLKPGDRFLEYRLVATLGQGGMGIVFKAIEDLSDDTVAIKVLSPGAAARADFTARFSEECKFYPKLKHPNIVRTRRTGVAQVPPPPPATASVPVPFIVMDLLVGKTLRRILDRYHRLDYWNTLHVLIQIAGAMSVVHGTGIVHRDLKPENIMVGSSGDEKGHVWIMDFGIATDLRRGLNTDDMPDVGTARYMAPEQVRNIFSAGKKGKRIRIDHRADIYAFGVIAYEVITGRHHFVNDDDPPPFEEILAGHLVADPAPIYELVPELPDHLESLWTIVHRCLAIDPERRYQHFHEVQADLQALVRSSVPATHVLGKRVAAEKAKQVRRAAFASLSEERAVEKAHEQESPGREARPPAPPALADAATVPSEVALRSAPAPTAAPTATTSERTADSGAAEPEARLTAPLLNYVPKANPLPFVPAASPFVPPVSVGVRGTVKMDRPEIAPPGATPTATPPPVIPLNTPNGTRPLNPAPVARLAFGLPAPAPPTWSAPLRAQGGANVQPAGPSLERATSNGPTPTPPASMTSPSRHPRRRLFLAPLIGLTIVMAAASAIAIASRSVARVSPTPAASDSATPAPEAVAAAPSSATSSLASATSSSAQPSAAAAPADPPEASEARPRGGAPPVASSSAPATPQPPITRATQAPPKPTPPRNPPARTRGVLFGVDE